MTTVKIKIAIQPHWHGKYRIEYDSKYITLFGQDNRYKGFKFNEDDDDWFEEMVLDPCVCELRNAKPEIEAVTDKDIIINLGIPEGGRYVV